MSSIVAQYVVVFTAGLGSLLTGAAVVHEFYKPSLAVPTYIKKPDSEENPPDSYSNKDK
jgi:hypothetical protein